MCVDPIAVYVELLSQSCSIDVSPGSQVVAIGFEQLYDSAGDGLYEIRAA